MRFDETLGLERSQELVFCLKIILIRLLNLISCEISGDLVKRHSLKIPLNHTSCEISRDLVKDTSERDSSNLLQLLKTLQVMRFLANVSVISWNFFQAFHSEGRYH